LSILWYSHSDQIEIIRKDINGLNRAALEGLGEAKPEGGVFGIGAKARSKNELLKDCQQFYLEGGYNSRTH